MRGKRLLLPGASLLLVGWGGWQLAQPSGPPRLPAGIAAPAITARAPSPSTPPAPPVLALPRSAPVRIAIPAINLRAPVDQIGLERDGTIETPSYAKPHNTAWYRHGPTPGEPGPAVILGHVDSKKTLAAFFYLTSLKPGHRIEITRADGRVAGFTVDSVEKFAKSAFPTDRVYGDAAQPLLRLVTCGGPLRQEASGVPRQRHRHRLRPPRRCGTTLIGRVCIEPWCN